MNLDDLIRNTKEGLPVSPQDAARHKKRLKANKFFDMTKEIKSDGTLGGKKLSNKERIAGFKAARGGADSVDWKKFVNDVESRKEEASIGKSMKMLPGSERGSVLQDIATDVKSILGIIDARTEAEEDATDELKQEKEKDTRKGKEEGKEKDAKDKKGKIPGFIKKATAPIENILGAIVKTFSLLLAGWGLSKLLDWLGNPANAQAVEDLKEFITVALPPILKGILALVALNIGLRIFKFAKMLALGSIKLLKGLKQMALGVAKWAMAHPRLALGMGLTAATAALFLSSKGSDDDEQGTAGELGVSSNIEDMVNPEVVMMSGGGLARGTDTVPAMLSPGEFVMSRGAVNEWGAGTLASMNAMGGGTNIPKRSGGVFYASGGGAVDDLAMPMIKQHEGLRLKKYTDTTGNITIGYGHLVDENENLPSRISREQANTLFEQDYNEHKEAAESIPGYSNADVKQKAALIDLTFNMGPGWVDGFPKFKKAFAAGNYNEAANELVNSSWYGQVESRGPVIVDMIRKITPASGELVRGKISPVENTATQLTNSVPGSSNSSGRTSLPSPSGSSDSGSSGGGSTSDIDMFSPVDGDNLSTLIMKSMYSILD